MKDGALVVFAALVIAAIGLWALIREGLVYLFHLVMSQ